MWVAWIVFVVGYMTTISEEYRAVLEKTHKGSGERGWGNTGSVKYLKPTLNLMERYNVTEMLDYGAGWGGMKAKMAELKPTVIVHEYEPARPEVAMPAEPCDFVVCHDVLEHIEPEYLDAVLLDLKRVINKFGYFSVCTVPALKKLSDGRNAHLIVEEFEWWLVKLAPHFHIRQARFYNSRQVSGDILVEKRCVQ